jgi:multiple sugar transport system substrate-binding protein
MRNSFRLGAFAAATALAATGITGCSSGGGEEAQEGDGQSLELMFWNWGSGAEAGWQRVADMFIEENPDVEVSLVPVAGENWGSYLANASTQIAGGAKPDLIYTATEGVKYLSSNNLLVPVDDLIEGDEEAEALVEDIAPNLMESLSADGQTWALPYAWNNMVMYYNTDRFEEAGVEPPSEDWTWDEFLETAKALTEDEDGDGDPERYGFTWASNEIFPGVLPWVVNAGGNLVTEDRCTVTVDSPEVTEAMTFLNDLIVTEKVSPAPSPMTDVFAQFQNGDVAMFGAGRWPLGTFIPEEFEAFDIQKWPTGKRYQTVFGVGGFPILQSSPNPELAWEFQKFASSTPVQELSVGSADAPATDIPALRSVAATLPDLGGAPANSQLFYNSVDEYDAIEWFFAPTQYSEFEAAFLRHTGLIFAGEVPVEEGLAAAQTELESIVSCD